MRVGLPDGFLFFSGNDAGFTFMRPYFETYGGFEAIAAVLLAYGVAGLRLLCRSEVAEKRMSTHSALPVRQFLAAHPSLSDHAVGVPTSLASLAAPVVISGPWCWVAGGVVYLGGQLIQGEINDARRTSQFEGPTRAYLEAAGIHPEIATILADYDDNGYDVAGRIVALAEHRGVKPAEIIEFLNRQDPKKVSEFVAAAQRIKPNDKGEYPSTAENDLFVRALPGGYPSYAYDTHNPPRHSEAPRSITGLSFFVSRVFNTGSLPGG